MRTAEVDAALEVLPEQIAPFDESGIPSATKRVASDNKLGGLAMALAADPYSAVEAIRRVFSFAGGVGGGIGQLLDNMSVVTPRWEKYLKPLRSTSALSTITQALLNFLDSLRKS